MMIIRKCYKSIFVLLFLSILSCGGNQSNLESLDLLPHGLPIKIMAPKDAEVDFDDMGIIKDMTIKGANNYNIQIFSSRTNSLDVSIVANELKSSIENSQYFSKIITEENDGFIYERKVDEDYINYDFRFVKIRGDQQYVFQTGLSGKYTLEQVKELYQAVQ